MSECSADVRAPIIKLQAYCKQHFGSDIFPEKEWRHVLAAHGGKLPLRIRAVPEGTTLPIKNVLFTVENTDPECFWMVYVHPETFL